MLTKVCDLPTEITSIRFFFCRAFSTFAMQMGMLWMRSILVVFDSKMLLMGYVANLTFADKWIPSAFEGTKNSTNWYLIDIPRMCLRRGRKKRLIALFVFRTMNYDSCKFYGDGCFLGSVVIWEQKKEDCVEKPWKRFNSKKKSWKCSETN